MINFRKISAIGASALMVGMTAGIAAAANYPAPFVVGGSADVAVVYGTGAGVSVLDAVEAGNLQSNLQSYLTGTSGGTSTSTSGETVSLDTSSARIWLNESLNTAKTTLTKTDLPTVLKDYTFEGDVSSKMTSTVKLQAGAAAGGDNSGKVIFSKQPKSSNDPVVGISLGSSQTSNPLYNASVTMSAINFTHSDSEGEEIVLFGQKFRVSSDTSTTSLVLLKESSKVDLSSDSPSATVTIGGNEYTIELVSASDTSATIRVTNSAGVSESKEVNEADSKKINGVQIGVSTADETNLRLTASVIAGAEKLTFQSGSQITSGDNNDPIDGTFAYIIGGPNATTELAVTVFRPDSSNDAILSGSAFVDPVFGSFKVDFAGISSPLDDANRETLSVQNSGDNVMSLTMTDSNANTKTFDIAYNATYASNFKGALLPKEPAHWRLSDDTNNSIFVYEGANLTEDDYVVLGNEDYGHLVQVIQIYNNTGTDYTTDEVKLQDVLSGETYASTFTSEGSGTVSIDGKQYTVTFLGSGDTGYATVKYPTGDSGSTTTFVVYPTIETKNGALVALYEPLNVSLENFNGTASASTTLNFPDGDGYTSVVFTYTGASAAEYGNWSYSVAGGASVNDTTYSHTNMPAGTNSSVFTIGEWSYNVSNAGDNHTMIQLANPESTTAGLEASGLFGAPGVMVYEGKDDNSEYHGFLISLEDDMAGTSTDGVGVSDVLFTQDGEYYHASASLQSNSDITKDIDWWGTLTTIDAGDSDQKTISVSYPKSQVYAQVYLGESASAVSSATSAAAATQLGDVLVKDTEVSSVSSKNLIVVGGSCINSVAANVLGGAYCGAAFTDATGVGSGQFLVQSVADKYTTGKVALVVAGYDVSDTVNAAKYLRTQKVDTTAGKKYKGTTATSAELVVQ
jgi:hypothetical protein